MTPNFSDLVTAAWEQELREAPDPFDQPCMWLLRVTGWPAMSYRERLDRRRRNVYGEVIPRIVMVRRNLRALGKPRRPPRLP